MGSPFGSRAAWWMKDLAYASRDAGIRLLMCALYSGQDILTIFLLPLLVFSEGFNFRLQTHHTPIEKFEAFSHLRFEFVEPLLHPLEPLLYPLEPLVHPLEPLLHHLEPLFYPLKPLFYPHEPLVHPHEPLVHPHEPLVNRHEPLVHPLEPLINRLEPLVYPFEPLVNRHEPLVHPLEPLLNRLELLVYRFESPVVFFPESSNLAPYFRKCIGCSFVELGNGCSCFFFEVGDCGEDFLSHDYTPFAQYSYCIRIAPTIS